MRGNTLYGVGSALAGLGEVAQGYAAIKRNNLIEAQNAEEMAMKKRKFDLEMKKAEEEQAWNNTLEPIDVATKDLSPSVKTYLIDKARQAGGIITVGNTEFIKQGIKKKGILDISQSYDESKKLAEMTLNDTVEQINQIQQGLQTNQIKGKDAEQAQQTLAGLQDKVKMLGNKIVDAKTQWEAQQKEKQAREKAANTGLAGGLAQNIRTGQVSPDYVGEVYALDESVGKDLATELNKPENQKNPTETTLALLAQERDANNNPTPDAQKALAALELLNKGKAAGAPKTTVTVEREKKEQGKIGEYLGESYGKFQEGANKARGTMGTLSTIEKNLEGITTGKITPAATVVAAWAKSLGVNIDPNIGAKQAVQAFTSQLALQLRNTGEGAGMPGQLSDKDREFLMGMTPGLEKTVEGNKEIISSWKKLAKRQIDVAKKATEWLDKKGTMQGFDSYIADWSEKNPLFPSTVQGGTGFTIRRR
jgi:hypothetical protein